MMYNNYPISRFGYYMADEIEYPIPQGAGFYQAAPNGDITYAPNEVNAPDYVLIKSQRETYNYPVDGWTWFDDEIQARAALGLPPLPTPPEEE